MSTDNAERMDGWVNVASGLGMETPDSETHFMRERLLNHEELTSLYYGDDLAATVVSALPDEALRLPVEIVNPTRTPDEVRKVSERLQGMNWQHKVKQAANFARLLGDASVWIASEGEQPNPRRPGEKVRFLKHVDRRVMLVGKYYTDPLSENLGEPERYSVVPVGSTYNHDNLGASVHETRFAKFVGVHLDPVTRAYNMGWNYSVLQRCINVVADMGETWGGISALLRELSVKVLKVKGLQATRANRPDLVRFRLSQIKAGLSNFNLLAVDADSETFERVDAGALTGAAALLEIVLLRVAAAAHMPVSILFGRSPSGLNATGEADTRAWYASVRAYQTSELQPAMVEIVSAIGAEMFPGSVGWGVKFPSLWEPSAGEEIDNAVKVAGLDQMLITNSVFTSEQIATLRGGPGAHWRPDYSSLDITLAAALSRLPPPGEGEGDPDPEGGDGDPPPPAPPAAPKVPNGPPPPSRLPGSPGAPSAEGGP